MTYISTILSVRTEISVIFSRLLFIIKHFCKLAVLVDLFNLNRFKSSFCVIHNYPLSDKTDQSLDGA